MNLEGKRRIPTDRAKNVSVKSVIKRMSGRGDGHAFAAHAVYVCVVSFLQFVILVMIVILNESSN